MTWPKPDASAQKAAARFGAGLSPFRVEDARLLTGRGQFLGDRTFPGQLEMVVVRSPHAHAELGAIDVARARGMPGVAGVFTAEDLTRDGLGAMSSAAIIGSTDGRHLAAPPRYALARERARYVGDPVAIVVAERIDQAKDAAEAVEIAFTPQPALTSLREATQCGAPSLWPEATGNVAGVFQIGDADAVDTAMATARHVVRLALVNNRIVPNPMEPRVAIAIYDNESDKLTLHACCQAPHLMRRVLASEVLHITEDRLRILVSDMGGSFGARIAPYPEEALVLYAARKLARPVRWQAERTELFLAEHHGRDHESDCALALDADGRILALQADVLANMGAYLSYFGPAIATHTGNRVATGVYLVPALHIRVRCILTNTVPTGPYRGAGRPEAIYRLERLLDIAAAEIGMDPVELRQRNLVPRHAMPYRTAAGATYDSGDFNEVLDSAVRSADWADFPKRRAAARHRGRLRGRGIACHIDTTSGLEPSETVTVEADAEGVITLLSGTQAMGQGLATAYAQMAAARLGLAIGAITVLQGDTDHVASGIGSYGSRSLVIGGAAVARGVERLIEQGRKVAAQRLEAAEQDIEFADGHFFIVGTDRSVSLSELARSAQSGRLVAEDTATAPFCFPNGCCIAEVEIDMETGTTELVHLLAVDDVGTVVNPMIVHGQIHGGSAQGVGQALLERCHYDPGSGQLITGSLLDYCLPRADDLPAFQCFTNLSTAATTNMLGAKGAGECGVVGTPPAIVAAVVDALRDYGVYHLDMPIRSETIWRAIATGQILSGRTRRRKLRR
ncbi:MAG: xanthine dehydrogenase family protein molybdopterin-binding subunit [Steroidobacteraceae bacterium]|jgi:carbon-monoxide dehydrogenase large subunit